MMGVGAKRAIGLYRSCAPRQKSTSLPGLPSRPITKSPAGDSSARKHNPLQTAPLAFSAWPHSASGVHRPLSAPTIDVSPIASVNPKAITATARKLAILVYRTLKDGLVYQDPGAAAYNAQDRSRAVRRLTQRAADLGFALIDTQTGDVVQAVVS